MSHYNRLFKGLILTLASVSMIALPYLANARGGAHRDGYRGNVNRNIDNNYRGNVVRNNSYYHNGQNYRYYKNGRYYNYYHGGNYYNYLHNGKYYKTCKQLKYNRNIRGTWVNNTTVCY